MQELINVRVHNYYWNEDLNCAVTTLQILSELFCPELYPQVIEAAFGLNAGRYSAQCGLVAGTLMFIGIYGNQNHIHKEKIIDLCYEFCSQFQKRFGSLLCKELRPQGFSPDHARA